jgi:putative ABC transport system substrate-binding protein
MAALAAKTATTSIPIVFVIGADPVQAGLVASLNRPGGNVTGISSMNTGLAAKQLEFLHQLLGRRARFAVLVNPTNPQNQSTLSEVEAAASAMNQQFEAVSAKTYRDISPAFDDAVRKRADALLIIADPLFASRPVQLATLAARHALPTIYALREFAVSLGGHREQSEITWREAAERADALRSVFAELSGLSARQVAAELNRRGIPTASGKQWHATQVIRVRERLAQ